MKTVQLISIIFILLTSSLACRIPGFSDRSRPPEITPIEATEVLPPVSLPSAQPAPVETVPVEIPTEAMQPKPNDEKTCTEIKDFKVCPPSKLSSALVASTIPEVKEGDGPFWDVMPEHFQIDLQGYPLTNTFLRPRIHIIPAADYFLLTEGALMTGNQLMEMMDSREPHPSSLPILPLVDAGPVITSRVKYIESDTFHGIEAVTQLAQSAAVINNTSLIYTFQGITNDEKYWIGIILPITQNSLPVDDKIIPGGDYEAFINQYETYTSEIEHTLDNASPDSFSPDYTLIQDVVQSITYNP